MLCYSSITLLLQLALAHTCFLGLWKALPHNSLPSWNASRGAVPRFFEDISSLDGQKDAEFSVEERGFLPTWCHMALFKYYFPGGSGGKESACSVGGPGLNHGLGRSPGGENGYPFQYSCLENPMDRGAWQATIHGVTESDMIGWLILSTFRES